MYLQLHNIRKSFGSRESRTEVLKGISFSMNRGEFCVLLGPSGSGKSTLLNIIGGIETPDSGTLEVGGESIRAMNDRALTRYRRTHLGYVFQSYNLIPNLTAEENIETGAYLSDHPLDTEEMLQILGLSEHRRKRPNQLSGGQQQRVSIGRAVVKNPSLLLCDEPTGALDYQTSKDILKLLEQINHHFGTTILMVTHNDALKDMADRVIRLKDGRIRENTQNSAKIPAEDLEW
ncbi:MAG: ABC transporter ATP-binding protein [Clostridiales bacterium]|jgi:putative ABC transport system ATP-binding protein|nr:ABC transporter ATP-binding protein [Clostridiales bacterium]